jgi:hypothetical protein
MSDLSRIEAITFDCFGTLIEWGAGSGAPKATSPVPTLEVPTLRKLAERLSVPVGVHD